MMRQIIEEEEEIIEEEDARRKSDKSDASFGSRQSEAERLS